VENEAFCKENTAALPVRHMLEHDMAHHLRSGPGCKAGARPQGHSESLIFV